MGLDLIHYKATNNPDNQDDYQFFDEFTDEEINTYNLHKYAQQLPDYEHLHTVLFLNNIKDKDYEESNQKENGYKTGEVSYLVGTVEENDNQLRLIEASKKLERSQAWFSTASETSEKRKISYSFASYSKNILSKGFYVNEVGYQRKCMSNQFYKNYTKYFYLDKESFDNLSKYVAEECCNDAKRNIEENFINNYEEGKSILCVST